MKPANHLPRTSSSKRAAHHLVFSFLLGVTTIFGTTTGSIAAGIVFGGFDFSRSNTSSMTAGTNYTDLRTDITSTFPGSSFTSSPTLTTSYLSTVNVLLINSGGQTGSFSVGTALTAAEQSALTNFILSGGAAIILVDNDTFGGSGAPTDAVNQSFISPFGLHVFGKLSANPAIANVTNTTHPVTNGPFGLVSSFSTGDPGWFDNLGSNATGLARLTANNNIPLAVINRGALSSTSGGVVLLSDFNTFDNGRLPLTNNRVLERNAIAYLTPEPSGFLLTTTGIFTLVAGRRVRRSAKQLQTPSPK